jgi:hypothetical protein
MKKNLLRPALAAFAPFLLAAGIEAQVFTPTFTSPRLLNEMGVYVNDGPGDISIAGIWRGGPLGLRVGYVDWRGGLLSLGAEYRIPMPLAGAPLGLAFVASAQGLVGDDSGFGFVGGLTAGHTFRGTGIFFTPYIHPRLGAVNPVGGDGMELELLADVGVDVEFYTNLVLRLGLNFAGGQNSAWGVGVAWRR